MVKAEKYRAHEVVCKDAQSCDSDFESQDNDKARTLAYYDEKGQEFFDRTVGADMANERSFFLSLLPEKASILDAGCGSGRDSKVFIDKGYTVTSFDGSPEMVRLSSEFTGKRTLHMLYDEIQFQNDFDGIWANASFLHVPYKDMRALFEKCYAALKPDGIFYVSFKYGDTAMEKDGRYFSNMTEKCILPYLHTLFDVIRLEKIADRRSSRAPSPEHAWLYCFFRKMHVSKQ